MPPRCTVCSHPDLADINKALLVAKGSKRAVAVRYGLNPASIQRHRTGCLGQKTPPKEPKTSAGPRERSDEAGSVRFGDDDAEITSPRDLLDRLGRLLRIGNMLDAAIANGDTDSTAKIAREYRATVESYAKIAGWLTDGALTTVDARTQYNVLISDLSIEEKRALRDSLKAQARAGMTLADASDNGELSPVLFSRPALASATIDVDPLPNPPEETK